MFDNESPRIPTTAASGSRLRRVLATLEPRQRTLVQKVLEAGAARGDAEPPGSPLRTPAWLARHNLSDLEWRELKQLRPGALTAAAIAERIDNGAITAIVMVETGPFAQNARPSDPAWVPDRVPIDGHALAVRGEVAIVGRTPDNELVRLAVRDIPLGGLGDATGATFLAALLDDIEQNVLREGSPLAALGLATAPVFLRLAGSLGTAHGQAGVSARIGIDQLPVLRRRIDAIGMKLVARLEDGRSPLMADLVPLVRDRHGRLRVAGGPRVLLRHRVVARLRDRQLDAADVHATSLDDEAYDGQSYLTVYASGFGLPDEAGRFQAAAVARLQTAVPGVYLISNWDLRSALLRQELAAVLHHVTVPELPEIIDECRARARWWVDAHRPALRDPAADNVAAETEHVQYAFMRLAQLVRAHLAG